jgi:small subunit ribosomal protein S13
VNINNWLKSFYGINYTRAYMVYSKFGLNYAYKVLALKKFNFTFITMLKNYLVNFYLVERLLRLKLNTWLKFLFKLGDYKAFRLKFGLPVNGQKTRTNAKTARRLNILLARKF